MAAARAAAHGPFATFSAFMHLDHQTAAAAQVAAGGVSGKKRFLTVYLKIWSRIREKSFIS